MSNVQQSFQPAFDEIQRRRRAAESEEDSSYFTPNEKARKECVHGQTYALVTLGTPVLAPRPLDPSRPSLRVYGFFATKEECRDHAQVVRELDPACSLVVLERESWALMPTCEKERDDPHTNETVRAAVLAEHRKKQEEQNRRFEEAVADKKGAPDATPVPLLDEEQVETREAESVVYKSLKSMRRGAEVRGQDFFAVAIVPHPDGKCLLNLLGGFETADDAAAWIESYGSRDFRDDDILVARMCEWVYPNAEAKSSSVLYRHSELQKIMDACDKNVESVTNYKKWKREQDEAQEEEERRASKLEHLLEHDNQGEHVEGGGARDCGGSDGAPARQSQVEDDCAHPGAQGDTEARPEQSRPDDAGL